MKMIRANNNLVKFFYKISCCNKAGFDETIKSVSEKISIIPISLLIISTDLNGDETQR